jgi:hypothetical protein
MPPSAEHGDCAPGDGCCQASLRRSTVANNRLPSKPRSGVDAKTTYIERPMLTSDVDLTRDEAGFSAIARFHRTKLDGQPACKPIAHKAFLEEK